MKKQIVALGALLMLGFASLPTMAACPCFNSCNCCCKSYSYQVHSCCPAAPIAAPCCPAKVMPCCPKRVLKPCCPCQAMPCAACPCPAAPVEPCCDKPSTCNDCCD